MTKEIWTVDAETDPFVHGEIPAPFIWGAYQLETDTYLEFSTTEELFEYFRYKKVILYAHNGGKFDFHFLKPFINTEEQILMIHSRLVKAKMGECEIRDSYALLPFPLKQIGAKKEIDYKKLDKKVRHKHMAEISSYLKADCVELAIAIRAFIDTYGMHLTAPSAAIKTMMKIENLDIPNSGGMFFEDFQPFYFGGRCECLKAGEYQEELTYLDINSAYPRAMMEKHPIGLDYKIEYKKKPKIIGQNFYIIKARSFGALCRRTKKGLQFDWDGEPREYHCTGWELQAGIDTGFLKDITHEVQYRFIFKKDFSQFINHFWELRQKSAKGSLENTFAKLMMNSAYGKFCSNPNEYDSYYIFENGLEDFLVANDWNLHGEFGGNILASQPLNPDFMRFYNVATGASITGYVRAFLMRAIANVENPIYCDTDSLIFTGKHSLELGSKLGEWKIEGIYNEGYFAGKKLYAVKNKQEEKTANKGARLSFEQIRNISLGQEIEYKQDSPIFSWKKETSFLTRKIKKTACN